VCRLFRIERLSITNPFSRFPVSRFPVLQFGAAFSSSAFSSPAVWCRVFQSRVVQSCSSVLRFPVPRFPVSRFQRPRWMLDDQFSLQCFASQTDRQTDKHNNKRHNSIALCTARPCWGATRKTLLLKRHLASYVVNSPLTGADCGRKCNIEYV